MTNEFPAGPTAAGGGRPWRAVLLVGLLIAVAGLASTVVWLESAAATSAGTPSLSRLALATAAVCLMTAVNVGLRWLRWHYLCRRQGIFVPTRASTTIFTALLPAVLSPLALGELAQGFFLGAYTARPWRAALWMWLITRSADACALALMACLTLPPGKMALFALVCAAVVAVVHDALCVDRSSTLLERASETVVFTALSLASWAVVGAGVWLATWLVGRPLSPVAAAAAFGKASLLGAMSLSPGGVITTGSLLIREFEAQGLGLATAVSSTLAVRIGTTGFAILVGVACWALRWRRLVAIVDGSHAAPQEHFDELSATYVNEIPEHIRTRLLSRKLDAIVTVLESQRIGPGATGFDLGCGQGWYTIGMARRGYAMKGGELSPGQLACAVANGAEAGVAVDWLALDGEHVPAGDETLDFVYTINVLHHVTAPQSRATLLADVARALRPGGVLIVHEINTRNPLFRIYMSYVFPLTRRIDDGTERWLDPAAMPVIPGGHWLMPPAYFTFLPDFCPQALVAACAPLERWLETSWLASWSAHYSAVFVKDPV
jgi:2-polyprenyl-3-methyl-5-hydroxy-6-metoxy-1,4-benzoquinol methylase/uncharacterized membrane protein YbhN (UPF0104 family)